MMYPELYQYLILHKKLPVPGIGTFLLDRKPARIDFPNKQMLPPVYAVVMQPAAPVPPGSFFNWLGTVLGVSQMDAVIRFNDFAFEMKKQVDKGHLINWSGIGIIKKGLAGEIKFTPAEPSLTERPIPAEKVLREKAEHTVRVGEEERSSVEMEEMLTKPELRRSYWWVYAVATGLLAVVFTGWYFSEHGLDVSATANNKKLQVPEAASATYKELR